MDWYALYSDQEQQDPVGPADGMFKVSRGGSHNAALKYLRTVNRSATLPEDKHWQIGFRIVQAPLPKTEPSPSVPISMNDLSVNHYIAEWADPTITPVFEEPIPFVHPNEAHPLLSEFPHHHNPTITWCENGDLLAVWFNTISEIGREMVVVSSRLRYRNGDWSDSWETARLFFAPADRNVNGSCILHDGTGRIYFFNSISDSGHHKDQCMMMSVSEDSGRTWSRPRIVSDLFDRHKYTPMDSAFVEEGGKTVVVSMDYAPLGYTANEAGSGVFISRDRGETWIDRISGKTAPKVAAGNTDGLAAGFHISNVRLNDGRLLAMTRTQGGWDINGYMTMSYSSDGGATWTYRESPFPEIGGNQRLALLRLNEGPLLLVSFTHDYFKFLRAGLEPEGMEVRDDNGNTKRIFGMYAALSFDEGETWPVRRSVSPGGPPKQLEGVNLSGSFLLDDTHAEPRGYLAATQTPDGTIHVLSSGLHYRFNLSWLTEGANFFTEH